MLQNYSDNVSYSCHRDGFVLELNKVKTRLKSKLLLVTKCVGIQQLSHPCPGELSANNSEQIMCRESYIEQGSYTATWNSFGTESCALAEHLAKYRLAVRYQRLV